MQCIYTYIPETNCVNREYSVAAILLLLFMVLISLVSVLNLLYSYSYSYHHHHHLLCARYLYLYSRDKLCPQGIQCCNCSVVTIHGAYIISSSVESIVLLHQYFPQYMCAVPNMAVFCSSLTSCFPYMLLTYFLNDFEIAPVAPIITGFTFVFTFHMRCLLLLLLLLLTAIGLLPGGSGYFTCKQNMKLFTTRFKSGGLHEKHVVATWNVGNRLSICLQTQGNREKPVSRWPVAGPSEY